MKYLTLLTSLILLCRCGAQEYGGNTYEMTRETEPGQPIEISFSIQDSDTREPIPYAEVHLYQTDSTGRYRPSDQNDETTARLHLKLTSDDQGQFKVITILPGEYPNSPLGNRHIHYDHIRATGYKEKGGVIVFEHNVNDEVRDWVNDTGFGLICKLDRTNSVWRGNLTIYLESDN